MREAVRVWSPIHSALMMSVNPDCEQKQTLSLAKNYTWTSKSSFFFFFTCSPTTRQHRSVRMTQCSASYQLLVSQRPHTHTLGVVGNIPLLDLLLPGETLLGPLLILFVLRHVRGRIQGLSSKVQCWDKLTGLGVRCGLWSWNDPSFIWSGPYRNSPLTQSVSLIPRALQIWNFFFFSPLLPEPDLLLVLDWDLETDEDISWILQL